jgi:predicted metal-binding protein
VTESDIQKIEELAKHFGAEECKWTSGKEVQVGQWVRFKCMFGCESYGKKGGCPPAVPPVPECRALFAEYDRILVMRLSTKLEDPEDRKKWCLKRNAKLLKLEREVFLSGYHKVFLLKMDECRMCKDCAATRIDCKNPKLARPSPEALAVDVFGTVRALGFPIEVLSEYDQTMNRYAFLLVE